MDTWQVGLMTCCMSLQYQASSVTLPLLKGSGASAAIAAVSNLSSVKYI